MQKSLVAYPGITRKKVWIPILAVGLANLYGFLFAEAPYPCGLIGLLIVLVLLPKLFRSRTRSLVMNQDGLRSHEFGLIPWSDIKDLSWTVEGLKGGAETALLPKKWRQNISMYVDVGDVLPYWERLSWYQKHLHRTDRNAGRKKNRLKKSLKFYTVNQDEILKQACLVFYRYKRERATLCYRVGLDPSRSSAETR
jgi:hypothetical protein